MRKIYLVSLAIFLITALIFSSCAEATPTTTTEEVTTTEVINLKFATFLPATAVQSVLWQEFCEELEKQSDGRISVTFYPGGSLLGESELADGIKTGIADMGYVPIAYSPGRFIVTETQNLAIGSPTAYVSSGAHYDFYNEFKPAELDEYHVMSIASCGPFCLWSKTPIRTLEDMQGLKIRVKGAQTKLIEATGAAAVDMPAGELYDALSKGVVDGAFGPFEMAKNFRIADVCKYVTPMWQASPSGTFPVAMNLNSYNSLPSDLKEIFDELASETREKDALSWNEADIIGYEYAVEMGVEYIDMATAEMDKFVEIANTIEGEYIQDAVDRGFSEQEVRSWYDYTDERIDYWLNKQIEMDIKSPCGPEEIRP